MSSQLTRETAVRIGDQIRTRDWFLLSRPQTLWFRAGARGTLAMLAARNSLIGLP